MFIFLGQKKYGLWGDFSEKFQVLCKNPDEVTRFDGCPIARGGAVAAQVRSRMATKYSRSKKALFIEYAPAVQEVPGSIPG